MTNTALFIVDTLHALANPEIASHSQRFFKTGKGEYGEGDKFLGIRVPIIRQQVKIFHEISLAENKLLLHSEFHEARLLAVLLLVKKYKNGDQPEKKAIVDLYLSNAKYINNWDIVDSSAHLIVGPYLTERSHHKLYQLAKSDSIWERRIAVMSTFHFIKLGQFESALKIIESLLKDKEDLIHKATGWMLREIGNRDRSIEEEFLQRFYEFMPRTMLRYAIEKFPEPRRKQYLLGTV